MTDWADDEAEKRLRFLLMCDTHAERVEYLSAVLRLAEATGAVRAGDEYRAAIADAFSKEKAA